MQQADDRRAMRLLAILSAASLFLELVIIRWLSSEIRIFSHVQNIALIACFVGLALGYPLKRIRLPLYMCPLAFSVLLLASLPPQYEWVGDWTLKLLNSRLHAGDPHAIFTVGPIGQWLPGLMEFLFAFVLVILIFIPIGQRIGEQFRVASSPLRAYTWNVAASLFGVLAFTGLSVLDSPPTVWFAIGFGLLTFSCFANERIVTGLLGVLVLVITQFQQYDHPTILERIWSPYQKVQVTSVGALPKEGGGWTIKAGNVGPDGLQFYLLDTNDVAMMWILDMSKETRAKYPWLSRPGKIEWYDFPYHLYPHPKRVLVIGAGGGNDIAAALRHDVEHVDAVEIDPVIVEMGRKYHPEHPYSDPRVSVHITDARHFFQTPPAEPFDLIVFGQLDNTNLANIRMDSYVYTIESLKQAYSLLGPGGIMVVNFGSGDFWGQRITKTLLEATGQKALGVRNELQYNFPGTENAYVVGDLEKCQQSIATDPELAAWMKAKQADWDPNEEKCRVTDDWPYHYLAKAAIPPSHVLFLSVFLGFCLLLTRLLLPEGFVFQGHYWALGAAFTLLETHLVSKTGLLFGSTWMVNGFVVAMVLVMILLANVWVERFGPPSYARVYPALLVAGFLQWLLPPAKFLALGSALGSTLALALYTLPLLFAGLVFARGFRKCESPDQALTANLLGAVTGGFLEAISYITGMSALVLLVLALYGLSWFLAPKHT